MCTHRIQDAVVLPAACYLGGTRGEIQGNLIFLSKASGCRGRSPSELGLCNPWWGRAVLQRTGSAPCVQSCTIPALPGKTREGLFSHGNQGGFVFPSCPVSGPGQESRCKWKQLLCSPGNRLKTSLALCDVLGVGKMERSGNSSWRGARLGATSWLNPGDFIRVILP